MPTSFSSTPERSLAVEAPVSPDDEPTDESADEPDDEEQWNDGGDSWWAPHPVPPSYRDAT